MASVADSSTIAREQNKSYDFFILFYSDAKCTWLLVRHITRYIKGDPTLLADSLYALQTDMVQRGGAKRRQFIQEQ